jgi:adenylate kinase
MGTQGAGKGTQARLLSDRVSLPIVATGDILRDVARSKSDLGQTVEQLQSEGRLVPDEILARIVRDRTSQADCRAGYILDGFPRTLPQAELLEGVARDQAHELMAINIEVPREMLWRRLGGRRTCSHCGALYNIYSRPSKVEGVCDLDGHPLFTRSDDNEESIRQRLQLYDEKTRPLLAYYRESGRLFDVDGSGSPEEVFRQIVPLLRERERAVT